MKESGIEETVLTTPSQAAEDFPSWPSFTSDQLDAANRVLRSGKVNYWTGIEGRQFESEFAKYVGCKYGVAVANGTVALELALRALGIGPGDEVVTSTRTFIASASCIVAVGAIPVCADVEPDSQNITAETIRAVMTPATKAIIPVHLSGWPCEMESILELARDYGLKIIEDCAQAHGARYQGKPVGCFGDISAFSFCQDKIMTTAGEGGMVVTNDEELWRRMWSYKDHGKTYEAAHPTISTPGFRWLHESFGTNWRLTEVQSAVGRVALRCLDQWVAVRRSHASTLTQRFSGLPGLRVTKPPIHIFHSYYKYYVFVRPEELATGWDRDRIVEEITAEGVPCFVGSCSEIYLENAFPNNWQPVQPLTVARELGSCSLMFLVHPTLTKAHIERTGEVVEHVMSRAVCAPAAAALTAF